MRTAKLFLDKTSNIGEEANEPLMFIYRYLLRVWGIVLYRTVPHSSLIHEVVTVKPVLRLLFGVQRFAMENLRCVPARKGKDDVTTLS